MNNLANEERCNRILTGFSKSWRYIYAHLAGVCRRKLLLAIFGEESSSANASEDCCDVCSATNRNDIDLKDELNVYLVPYLSVDVKVNLKLLNGLGDQILHGPTDMTRRLFCMEIIKVEVCIFGGHSLSNVMFFVWYSWN